MARPESSPQVPFFMDDLTYGFKNLTVFFGLSEGARSPLAERGS